MILHVLLSACANETRLRPADTEEDPAILWEPGDQIPGWPTADCAQQASDGRVFETYYGGFYGGGASFLTLAPGVAEGAHAAESYGLELQGFLATCRESPCDTDDPTDPHAIAGEVHLKFLGLVDQTTSIGGLPLGWSGEDSWPQYRGEAVAEGNPFPERIIAGKIPSPPGNKLDFCIAEFQPDHLSGVLQFTVDGVSLLDHFVATSLFSNVVVFRVGFDIFLLPPCDQPEKEDLLWEYRFRQTGPSPPSEAEKLALYEQVWPWSRIEDDGLRQLIYDEYAPCE